MDEQQRAELVALGIFDPQAQDAAERLALLDFLLELGATTDEMLEVAHLRGGLAGLASIAALPKATVTLRQLADRIGTSSERLAEDWTALGLPAPDPDQPLLADEEVESLSALAGAAAMLPTGARRQLLRAVGRSVGQLADALVQAYLFDMEQPGMSEMARAQMAAAGQQILSGNVAGLEVILLRHMKRAAIRLRQSWAEDDNVLAVGFIDLVGFTPLSFKLDVDSLEELLDHFEQLSTRWITAAGGWIIKMIGDEVMFGATDADAAVRVVAAVFDALRRERPDLTPTGGIDLGPVLARGGDYFGPVVNLASRATSIAVPGEALVTQAIRDNIDVVPDGYILEAGGRRQLKGVDAPIPLWSLRREHEDR